MEPVRLVAFIMLVALMLQSGLQIDREHVTTGARTAWLLGRALLVNVVVVPAAAVLIARGLSLDDAIATGLLLMSIAPGVPFLPNAAGNRVGGNLAFALTLCFMLPAVSIVTFPASARLVLSGAAQVHMPIHAIATTLLVFQLVPLLLGVGIALASPRAAQLVLRITAVIIAVSIVLVLFILAPGILKAVAAVHGTYGLLAALTLVLVSLAAGWLGGGPRADCQTTLAVATALRNFGLALAVATADFPHTLVAPMVLSYFIIQVVAGTIFARIVAPRLRPAPAV